ncbi:MAG: hypothetical protein FWF33_05070, partial [Clostridiales bacterium]|nr:hypothetical protein [Clostridiales bacterium]
FMKILGSKLLKNLYSNFVKILPSEFMKKVLAFCNSGAYLKQGGRKRPLSSLVSRAASVFITN